MFFNRMSKEEKAIKLATVEEGFKSVGEYRELLKTVEGLITSNSTDYDKLVSLQQRLGSGMQACTGILQYEIKLSKEQVRAQKEFMDILQPKGLLLLQKLNKILQPYNEQKAAQVQAQAQAAFANFAAPQATAAQASSADELIKLKQLLDSGIITQAEFDAKKKQFLGL